MKFVFGPSPLSRRHFREGSDASLRLLASVLLANRLLGTGPATSCLRSKNRPRED